MYLLAFDCLKNQSRLRRPHVYIAVSGWHKSTCDAFAVNRGAYACEGNAKYVHWRGQLARDRHCKALVHAQPCLSLCWSPIGISTKNS